MSWQQYILPMCRAIVGDPSSTTETFTDARINQAIVVGGILVTGEFSFQTTYVFDVINTNIIPDPTDGGTFDMSAITLFALKASCILSTNTFQNAVGQGVLIKDGDSMIDNTKALKGYSDLLKLGPCGMYKQILKQQQMFNISKIGRMVSSPVSHADFLASSSYSTLWNIGIGGWTGAFR